MDTSFSEALRGLREVGASPDTAEIVTILARHGGEEQDMVRHYEELAADAASPAVRYLVGLIVEDERRHHRVLVELAGAIAWGRLPGGPDDATPVLDRAEAGNEELRRMTRRLLDHERADHAALVRLRRRLRPYAETTMWQLLVDIMIADTDKHRRILEFIDHHLLSTDLP